MELGSVPQPPHPLGAPEFRPVVPGTCEPLSGSRWRPVFPGTVPSEVTGLVITSCGAPERPARLLCCQPASGRSGCGAVARDLGSGVCQGHASVRP